MLTCVYDLAVSPPTFDFVGFLVSAERERKRRGEPQLRVIIAPGPKEGFRDDNLPPLVAERRRMLENVVKPMCSLLASCASVEECRAEDIAAADFPSGWSPTNRLAHYGLKYMADAFRVGCYPLGLKDVEPDNKLITITFRATEYWPSRNSRQHLWEVLAGRLMHDGYTVHFVPDALTVRKPGYGYCNVEQFDLLARARLYESATLNLFVNNGPAWVAAFMPQVPGLIFKMCAQDAPCVNPEYFAKVGFPVGSQVGRAGFRVVWADDDLHTLMHETRAELEHPTPATLKLIIPETFDNTLNNDRKAMLAQVKANLERDLPWFPGAKPHKRTALIVGGAPSLADTLPNLRMRYERGGDIFALNGAHDWLIERGIIPQYHVLLDSRQENVSFVGKPHKDVHYLISAFCHPDVFEALKGYRVTLWTSDMEGVADLVRHIEDKPVCLVGGGATVGCKTMFLAFLYGYRKEHFYGFDSCYQGDANHAYPQPMNANEQRVEIVARSTSGEERKFICAPWMTKQAEQWKGQAKRLIAEGCELWVHGDGLIPWIAQQLGKEKQAA